MWLCGPGSVVGIATGYGLEGPETESRWKARFSVPVQTGPGAHPASCTMGTGSFPGVKSGQGMTLTTHPLLVPGHERVELYLFSPYGLYGLYRVSVPVQGCTVPTRASVPVQGCTLPTRASVPVQGCTLPTRASVPVQWCTLPTRASVPVQGCTLPTFLFIVLWTVNIPFIYAAVNENNSYIFWNEQGCWKYL
jgi:hypothetical protein